MPTGQPSVVKITWDSPEVEITENVIFASAKFTTLMNGIPGPFEITVRDPNQEYDFITGHELYLYLDDEKVYGGYITQISATYIMPADKIEDAGTYDKRAWVLRGVDFNINFDRRVIRRTADYLTALPFVAVDVFDGEALIFLIDNYLDFPTFDTSNMDNVQYFNIEGPSGRTGAYVQQGSKWRDQMQNTAQLAGALYFINANKEIHYHGYDTLESTWGFSDDPDSVDTFGFREVEVTRDGSVIVNDALVWGGSQFAGTGGTVFNRTIDVTSENTYGRWQTAEVHFGEEGYGIQAGVDARADAIVNGPPGANAYNQQKGLRFPQWTAKFTFFSTDIPAIPQPGYIFPITLSAFGIDMPLPMRSLTMTFPEVDGNGAALVKMVGDFALLVSDPWTLWAYLRKATERVITSVVGSTPDGATTTIFGAYGSFAVTSLGAGLYSIPFGYIPGTLLVYDSGGLLMTPGTVITESNPVAGIFLAASGTPAFATCRTLHT